MLQALELSSFLTPDRTLDLGSYNKDELLETMLSVIVKDPAVHNSELVCKAVIDREHKGCTGIGQGIAIPHARCECIDDFVVAFARVKEGLDYGSDDGLPVKLVFMIVASVHQDSQYIKLLSRLMLRLRNTEFVDKLMSAEDTKTMYKLLRETR